MKRFARLYDELDRTTSTNAKVAALVRYLTEAPPGDAAWALFFLTGRRLKRHLPSRLLHEWTLELTALPEWLVRESYGAVGDYAEAVALLVNGRVAPLSPEDLRRPLPAGNGRLPFDEAPPAVEDVVEDVSLATWIERRVLPLRDLDDEEKRVHVLTWWSRLPRNELFLLNKLLTGEFRVGVAHTLVVRAVAQHASLPPAVVEHRLMGPWEPSREMLEALLAPEDAGGDPSRPYPFCLASPLMDPVDSLGPREDWLVEWKWDGIRAQGVHRAGGAGGDFGAGGAGGDFGAGGAGLWGWWGGWGRWGGWGGWGLWGGWGWWGRWGGWGTWGSVLVVAGRGVDYQSVSGDRGCDRVAADRYCARR